MKVFPRIVSDVEMQDALEVEGRIAFLAEATKVFLATLNCDRIFASLARLMVPVLADFCIVYRTEEAPCASRVAHAHSSPEKESRLDRLLAPRIALNQASPITVSMRHGRAGLHVVNAGTGNGLFGHEPQQAAIGEFLNTVSVMLLLAGRPCFR
jgi:hypothetical protein